MDWLEAGLADFALVYAVTFWSRTEWLRERLGIYYVEQDGVEERVDAGGLGAWLNCPMCAAVALFPLAWAFRKALSGLGLAFLLVRWFEAARPKARWWL